LAILQTSKNKSVTINNSNPSEAIPVRLTDKTGRKFYDAIMQAFSSGECYPFRLPTGETARANLDENGNIAITITSASIDNFPVEYPLPDSQVATLTPPAAITGFALEITLQSVLNSLNDIQTTAETLGLEATLQQILTQLGSLALDSTLETVDTRLEDIAQNTGSLVSQGSSPQTATVTSVNDTALSTQLLAANTNRKGATFYNDSSSRLYLKLGTTATTTSYTIQIAPSGYYEIPNGYTGRVDGIWSADSTGAVRITELT